MIVLLVTLPLIAFLSMRAFYDLHLVVTNYEGKTIPYSLGVVVIYSYAVMYAHFSETSEALSLYSFIYIFGIWFIGFIDDMFGEPFPKGLRGHFSFLLKYHVITTGTVKVIGTVMLALYFLFERSGELSFVHAIHFLLLIGLPHVMNLFDTKPLRVWKVAFLFFAIMLLFVPISTSILIVLATVFITIFIFEGKKMAMLGDNGATTVGAIVAIMIIHYTTIPIQLVILLFVYSFILFAERWSISTTIERFYLLKLIDRLGVSK